MSARRETRVAASLLADMAGYLRLRGVDADAVCRRAGLDPALARTPNERVPGARMAAFWDAALAVTGDPDLGLHMAEAFTPGALDIVGYVMLSCPTAHDALRRGARYLRLLNDGLSLDLVPGDGVVTCVLRVHEELDDYVVRAPRQPTETLLAGLLHQARLLTERPLVARAVRLRHPAPTTGAGEHRRIFGVAPQFAAPDYAVVLDAADLARPLRSANPALLAAFERHAADALALLAATDTLAGRVLAEVVTRLRGEAPPVGAVARALATSVRHLQRGLRAERTTYVAVVDDARRALALRHLSAPDATVAQVAFLLGFSEPSAFQRAFRRWTGQTPGGYRQATLAGARLA